MTVFMDESKLKWLIKIKTFQEKGDESEKEDPGFFELPPGFPSLESLGSGFESMKIRNKRSAGDLDVGEQRIRRRQFANNPYSQQQPGRHRRQHSGNSNNDYSFQQNFWDDVDIDTRDFFNPQTAAPQVQQQQGEYFAVILSKSQTL